MALADTARRIAAEDDYPKTPEGADRLFEQLRLERPDAQTASLQRAAYDALGIARPPSQATVDRALTGRYRRGRRVKGRARRARQAAARATRTVRVAPASTFGSLIAQALGLVALYWAIRSAGAISGILDSAARAARWLMQPVGWGQSPT